MKNEYHELVRQAPHLRHDPFIRQQLRREDRINEDNSMHPMSQLPSKSGWITLLQNRTLLRSCGNLHHSIKVYYHYPSKSVGPTQHYEPSAFTPFRSAKCKHNVRPDGWIYGEL